MHEITYGICASTAQKLPKSLFSCKVRKFKIGSDVPAARKFLEQQGYILVMKLTHLLAHLLAHFLALYLYIFTTDFAEILSQR